MFPNASVSKDTSEHLAAPGPAHPRVESKTPSLRPSSSQNDGVQEPESSSTSELPPYFRNTPLENPFRDGDASGGYSYPNSNGVQKGPKSATATHAEPPPATTATLLDTLPSAPVTDNDPFVDTMVLDESLPPPLPPRPSGLKRGLQIPSRVSLITCGFSFPEILAEQGVSKTQWRMFKHELETFARMSLSQWITVAAIDILICNFGPITGAVAGWKMKKHREHRNFVLAYRTGNLKIFEDRWNHDYFHPLGLHVRVEPPGVGRMDGMDVASSKLFRYQRKMGTSSPGPGLASEQADKKEYKYQFKEGRYRLKAAQKGRIIILPLDKVERPPLPPRRTDSQSHNGQSQGVTTIRGSTLFQDFAGLDRRRSDAEGAI